MKYCYADHPTHGYELIIGVNESNAIQSIEDDKNNEVELTVKEKELLQIEVDNYFD